MDWTELTEILRVLVNDLDAVTYTDETLERILAVAARQVLQEMDFAYPYVVTIGDEPDITPDPTDDETPTRDDSFINLLTIKAACIVDQGAATLAAKQAIAVKDGTSSIDLRTVMLGKLKLLEKGWCAVYRDTKQEYQANSASIAGAMVMTPFRQYAQGFYGGGSVQAVRFAN